MPPKRNSQYESAFSRGNAMSRAPIISGTRKFASPAQNGTMNRKIIVVPWIVKSSLYVLRVMNVSFACASWERISSARIPPAAKKTSDVPM